METLRLGSRGPFVELRGYEKAGYEIDYNEADKKPIMNFIPEYKSCDVNGTEKALEMIMLAGSNYVKLRKLGKLGIEVGYDDVRKIPVLNT